MNNSDNQETDTPAEATVITFECLADLPDTLTLHQRIEACAAFAWSYYQSVAKAPLDPTDLRISESGAFKAIVRPNLHSGVEIVLDLGLVVELDKVWERVCQERVPESGIPGLEPPTVQEWTHLSLTWLILHEIGHLHECHLELLDRPELGLHDGEAEHQLGATELTVSVEKPSITDSLRQAMEIEADTAAGLCFLGIYGTEMTPVDLSNIRFTALAAITTMILIDAKSNGSNKSRAYPSPSVRLFVLLGLAIQHAPRALKAAYIEGSKKGLSETDPADIEHLNDYRDFVLLPLMAHLETVCDVIGGPDYFESLGLNEEMILDIMDWSTCDDPTQISFRTEAAKKLSELLEAGRQLAQIRAQ